MRSSIHSQGFEIITNDWLFKRSKGERWVAMHRKLQLHCSCVLFCAWSILRFCARIDSIKAATRASASRRPQCEGLARCHRWHSQFQAPQRQPALVCVLIPCAIALRIRIPDCTKTSFNNGRFVAAGISCYAGSLLHC